MYLEANPVQNFNHKSEVSRNEGNMQQKEARRESGKVWVGKKINLEKYLKNVRFLLLI